MNIEEFGAFVAYPKQENFNLFFDMVNAELSSNDFILLDGLNIEALAQTAWTELIKFGDICQKQNLIFEALTYIRFIYANNCYVIVYERHPPYCVFVSETARFRKKPCKNGFFDILFLNCKELSSVISEYRAGEEM